MHLNTNSRASQGKGLSFLRALTFQVLAGSFEKAFLNLLFDLSGIQRFMQMKSKITRRYPCFKMCMQIVIATLFPMNWVSTNAHFLWFCGELLLIPGSVSISELLLIHSLLFYFNYP